MRLRKLVPVLLAGLGVLVATFAVATSAHAATTTLSAVASGSQEVPPNAATGSGALTVTVDDVTNQVCLDATGVVGFTGAVIGDHLHQAVAGVNGPIVVDFGGSLDTCVASDATTVSNILANPAGFYVNFHTATFPGGELRGQLALQQLVTLQATMSGANEVPPNASAGIGVVTVTIDTASEVICIDASAVTGLSGPSIGRHIHQAVAGVNGPIVAPFDADVSCTVSNASLDDAIVADPAGFYVNIHTATFPGGEVRGQLQVPVAPTTTTTSTSTSTSTTAPTTTTTVPAAARPVAATPAFTG
jgi:hypothetical protein